MSGLKRKMTMRKSVAYMAQSQKTLAQVIQTVYRQIDAIQHVLNLLIKAEISTLTEEDTALLKNLLAEAEKRQEELDKEMADAAAAVAAETKGEAQ